MPPRKHKDIIAGYQALIGHLGRQNKQEAHINALRNFITEIQKHKSIPLDLNGNPLRPRQTVAMRGKSYTILSLHMCSGVWGVRLAQHEKFKFQLMRTATEVVGW